MSCKINLINGHFKGFYTGYQMITIEQKVLKDLLLVIIVVYVTEHNSINYQQKACMHQADGFPSKKV